MNCPCLSSVKSVRSSEASCCGGIASITGDTAPGVTPEIIGTGGGSLRRIAGKPISSSNNARYPLPHLIIRYLDAPE
jgi:hypothetical protein